MWLRRSLVVVVCGLALIGVGVGVVWGQNPFRMYRSFEPYDNVKLPDDWQEKTEWVYARLMYPEHPECPAGAARAFRRVQLARRRHQLDAGLSARRPSLCPGAAAAHAAFRAVGRAARRIPTI